MTHGVNLYQIVKNSRISSKLFLRMLCSFIVILLISVVFSVFSYFKAEEAIKTEVFASGNASMDAMVNGINNMLFEQKKIFEQISASLVFMDCAFQDHRYKEINSYDIHRLSQEMKTIRRAYIEDIFIYFHDSDMIVSGIRSSVDSYIYYSAYFETYEYYYTNFMELVLTNTNKFDIIYNRGSAPQRQRQRLAVVSTLPMAYDSRYLNISAVCIIDLSRYLASLKDSQYKEGVLMLLNESGDTIISSDDSFLSRSFQDSLELKGFFDIDLDGVSYMMSVQPVQTEGYLCAFAIPSHLFSDRLKAFRTIQLLSLAFYTLIGLCFAYLLSRRNYEPLSQMIQRIAKRTNIEFNAHNISEENYVKDAVDSLIEQREDMLLSLQDHDHAAVQSLFSIALQGRYQPDDPGQLALHESGLPSDFHSVILLKIEKWNRSAYQDSDDKRADQLVSFVCKNVLSELLLPAKLFLLEQTNLELIGVLSCASDTNISYIKTRLNEGQRILAEKLQIVCSITYSIIRNGLANIFSSRKKASQLMNYRVVYGEGICLGEEDVDIRPVLLPEGFREEVECRLARAISSSGGIDQEFDLIVDDFGGSLIFTPDSVKCFMYDITVALENLLKKYHIEKSEIIETKYLIGCENLSEFRDKALNILRSIHGYLAEEKAGKNLVSQVLDYITGNSANPSLGVNTIAIQFKLSPSYLSKKFKTYYGQGIPEVITQIRMEKAKEMLLYHDKSVEEIAYDVGIMNSSSFIRIFKSCMKMTPGMYRKGKIV
jgi:AraC-like DNA-binding protein